MKHTILGILFFCLWQATAAMALEAFPSAAGFGKDAQGGRGGQIVYVSNRNDSGPGSLRQCAEVMSGPRICVFRVSGRWTLERGILITKPYVSILGQTAPGGGVLLTVKTSNTAAYPATPLVIKGTSQVIIQHIRSRPRFANTVANVDAITVENSSFVYIDHVSASWATDENFNLFKNGKNITIAYSIFGEGLKPHSKCALFSDPSNEPRSISFYRNLCHSNEDRNPDIKALPGSCIEVSQNIFYNNHTIGGWVEIFSPSPNATPVSIVQNYFKTGPNALSRSYAITYRRGSPSEPAPRIYHRDNYLWAAPGRQIGLLNPGDATTPPTANYVVPAPPCALSVPGETAIAAYDIVRSEAGAFPRDSIDQRFVKEVGNHLEAGTGSIVSVAPVLPAIAIGTPYADNDRDGMPDYWENVTRLVGLDPAALHGSGPFTNFDMAMHYLSLGRINPYTGNPYNYPR
jgi:pectate lyase